MAWEPQRRVQAWVSIIPELFSNGYILILLVTEPLVHFAAPHAVGGARDSRTAVEVNEKIIDNSKYHDQCDNIFSYNTRETTAPRMQGRPPINDK